MHAKPHPVTIAVDPGTRVSGLLQAPPKARACYVMAHGAGAGMTHAFMASFADELAERGVVFVGFPLHPPGKPGDERVDGRRREPVTCAGSDSRGTGPMRLMQVVLIVLLPLLASCAATPPPIRTAPPQNPLQTVPTPTPVAPPPPQAAPTQPSGATAPTQASVAIAPPQPPVATAPSPSPSAPSAAPPATAAPAKASTPTASATARAPAPTTQPPKTAPAAADAAKPKAPPLDLTSLQQRLKDTKAIGVMTKISLKNQVDDLLDLFRGFYQGKLKTTFAELRRSYDLLVQKVLALLQDSDPPLATAIVASRDEIWGILSDPKKFATL